MFPVFVLQHLLTFLDGRLGPGTLPLTSGSWWPAVGKRCSQGVWLSCRTWAVSKPRSTDPCREMGSICAHSSSGGRSSFQKLPVTCLVFYGAANISLMALSSHPGHLSMPSAREGQMSPSCLAQGSSQKSLWFLFTSVTFPSVATNGTFLLFPETRWAARSPP